MKNLILKRGDLVRYKVPNEMLNRLGYKLGHSYEVIEYGQGLAVQVEESIIQLVNDRGDVTVSADHFTLIRLDSILPKGLAN